MQAKAKDPTVFEAPDNSSRLNILRDIKPITICVLMMIFQQLSGINAVMFYSVSIFSDSGSWSPYVSTIILGIVNIFATIFSNSLIDLVGRYQTKCLNFGSVDVRKVLLCVSSTGMLISLATLGSHYHSHPASPALTPLIALIVFVISFSTG